MLLGHQCADQVGDEAGQFGREPDQFARDQFVPVRQQEESCNRDESKCQRQDLVPRHGSHRVADQADQRKGANATEHIDFSDRFLPLPLKSDQKREKQDQQDVLRLRRQPLTQCHGHAELSPSFRSQRVHARPRHRWPAPSARASAGSAPAAPHCCSPERYPRARPGSSQRAVRKPDRRCRARSLPDRRAGGPAGR